MIFEITGSPKGGGHGTRTPVGAEAIPPTAETSHALLIFGSGHKG